MHFSSILQQFGFNVRTHFSDCGLPDLFSFIHRSNSAKLVFGDAIQDPRYLGNRGEISAIFRSADEQEPDLTIGTRAMVRYLATGASTHGLFGLYRWELKPNTPGTKPHFHRTMSESFFVLSGKVHLFNGERWIDATAGDFLYVPEGGVHNFGNESDEPASMLILFAPGAPREEYFQALAEIAAGREVSDEEWAEICIRHDNYLFDPHSQALYEKLLSKNR